MRVQVKNLCYIDEKDPFDVFTLCVSTEYNQYVLHKSMDAFSELNENV